jgi:alkanesulfonate monooxygenase SsuD/methylene tetrahydromethanopterin reductase-like flavin-dependent oxidoreductase (luciferase family)
MSAYPEEEARKANCATLLFSNRHFDAKAAAELYRQRLAEYAWAEEVGFDGLMVNEHHNAVFSGSPRANILASTLASMTKKARIVILGNPLPIADNPILVAEELAMIDLISKGRLVSGFVRGAGVEQLASNTNPAYNRERMYEAHDLIVKAWTEPGPFRWEGVHYQQRVVNPWVLPLQKPHPRIWVPGLVSKDTVEWSARHGYPYVLMNQPAPMAEQVMNLYRSTAEAAGYSAGPEQFGYLLRCHVAETEEKARRNAAEFMWMEGEFTGRTKPIWADPSGYSGSPADRLRKHDAAGKQMQRSLDEQTEDLTLIAGTPGQVIQKLRTLFSLIPVGIVAIWASDGRVSHEDALSSIRLFGTEVLPALREIADEHGLKSPFEAETPVSRHPLPAPAGRSDPAGTPARLSSR